MKDASRVRFQYVVERCNLSLNLVWIRSYAKVMSFIIHRIWSNSIVQPMNYHYKNYNIASSLSPSPRAPIFWPIKHCLQPTYLLVRCSPAFKIQMIWLQSAEFGGFEETGFFTEIVRDINWNSIAHIQIQRREDISICSSPCFVL